MHQTLELLTRVTGHSDDITLLAARRTAVPEPLRVTLRVTDDDQRQLAGLRASIAAWMTEVGASADDEQAMRHALVELATNSLEHAYIDRVDAGATCEVTATVEADGRVLSRVRDHGVWREPDPSPDRGLGLQVASSLVDSVRIDRGHVNGDGDHIEGGDGDVNGDGDCGDSSAGEGCDGGDGDGSAGEGGDGDSSDRDGGESDGRTGTTVTVVFTLTRPARLLTTDQLTAGRPAARPAQTDLLLILDQPWAPAPRVRIDGPIDASTVAQVERAVREAGAAGTRDLTLDLTGVSHLASAGVAALHRAGAAHRGNGTSLRLFAPAASPAGTILTLVRLDHLTRDPHTSTEAEPRAESGPGPDLGSDPDPGSGTE